MSAADAVWWLAGALVIGVTIVDVFFTVLFPASGLGPLRRRLDSVVWRGTRLLAHRVPDRHRETVLSVAGPAQVSSTIVTWFVLLAVGFALVYRPSLGTGLTASSGPTEADFSTALYYSGSSLTTLGIGDIVATSDLLRMLTVIEGATGFAVMTMVITYFLSVFSALPTRNAVAASLRQRSGGSHDAAELVARQASGGPGPWQRWLTETADDLRRIEQTHRAYPVLRYFHFRDGSLALPRLLETCLEAVTVARSTLDRDRHGDLVDAPGVSELDLAASELLDSLRVPGRREDAPGALSAEARREWVAAHAAAVATLERHGYATTGDPSAYLQDRAAWDPPLRRLAEVSGHRLPSGGRR